MSSVPEIPHLFTTRDTNGVPVVSLELLRVAQEALDQLPPVSSSWSSFPPWCQEAIQKAMNEVYKVHHQQAFSLRSALDSLKRHRANGTFPQVVLSAFPGMSQFHMDNSLSNETRVSFSTSIENITAQARSALLNTIIESKETALAFHSEKERHFVSLAFCRDRIFESLVKMGYTMETVDVVQVTNTIRSLCHLKDNILSKVQASAWSKVQNDRKREASASAAAAVMDHTSDLTPPQMTESIEKLIKRQVSSSVASLTKSLKNLSVQKSSSSRPSRSSRPSSRPSGSSGSSSRTSGTKRSGSGSGSSSSGKGSRPSSSGSHKGRVSKGAPPPPRRLAPGPTPFKQLKGHKRG